jgi:hypothetical protein
MPYVNVDGSFQLVLLRLYMLSILSSKEKQLTQPSRDTRFH